MQVEEPGVVLPEEFKRFRRFVVAATLTGIGEPFEVRANFTRTQDVWQVWTVDFHGLSMHPDDLLEAIHRDRQRRTIADMRNIATALGVMRVDTGRYAEFLMELQQLGYMAVLPVNDGWGSAFVYVSSDTTTYVLTSLGSDGAAGPAPPDPWLDAPFGPDIILSDGRFIQAPTGRR